MTTAEQLWNDLNFCTKRREEQINYLRELYEKLYYKQITEARFRELWEPAFITLQKFRNRVKELRKPT